MNKQIATFIKMQAGGNDFILLDKITWPCPFAPADIQRLADRRCGIGFDQMLCLQERRGALHVTIYNADGSQAEQCGNGLRAIARYWLDQHPSMDHITLVTESGHYPAQRHPQGIQVNMGKAQVGYAQDTKQDAPSPPPFADGLSRLPGHHS